MVISIFTPPEEGKEWNECKTGDICDCLTFEYEKHFNGVGTFTLELPITTRFRDKVVVGSVLVTSDGDALIVKNIQTTLDKVKVTGYDLNGLLADRIILATDTDGTAPVKGTTEYCVKYYVESNLYACASDPNRNLPRFAVAENKDRGDPADNNMPRYAKLHDVVTEMCGAAKLGWRVSLNGSAGSGSPVFVFDVAEQVDKSVNQSERNRVIFSVQQHNVSEMTREVGVTAERNALYLDIDGTVVGYPQADDKSGRMVASGYSRREEYCALSGGSLEFDKYKAEAEQNIADRMAETDSLTIEAGNPLDYRVKYDVGDIVTVYDRERSLQLDSVISAVTVRRSGNEYSVKLTLGESKPKLLDQYAKKGEVVGRTVRNSAGKSPEGVISEYEYISDISVKFNGTTYTVEKDSTTGLISRISDDAGNEFEPAINSGITDVALHNAVFWAVAMCRGLSAPKIMPIRSGLVGYFDYKQRCRSSLWENILGTENIPITGSAAISADCLEMPNQTYGMFKMPYQDNGNFVLYAVVKVDYDETLNQHDCAIGSSNGDNIGSWRAISADGYSADEHFRCWFCDTYGGGIGTELSDGSSVKSYDKYSVITLIQSSGKLLMYINGIKSADSPSVTEKYGDFWGVNCLANSSGGVNRFSNTTGYFKMFAIGRTPHTAEQIATNGAWLKKYYGL